MDTLLSILAVVCGLTGVAGCFLPVLPGPPVAYLGLLLVHWTDYAQFSGEYLALWAVLTGAVTLADYLLPAWITGRLGGSRQATRGAAIGTLAGLFFMPWGLVLGPFAGAFIGEMLHDRTDNAGVPRGIRLFSRLCTRYGVEARSFPLDDFRYRKGGIVLIRRIFAEFWDCLRDCGEYTCLAAEGVRVRVRFWLS